MIPGTKLNDGSILVTTVAPTAADPRSGGIATTNVGVVHVTDSANPDVFANGFGLTNDGALCVDPGGTAAGFAMGLPFTAAGRLVAQLDQPVGPNDAYVGGVRVGPLGGVYLTTAAPPPPPLRGFSNGFSNGYGA